MSIGTFMILSFILHFTYCEIETVIHLNESNFNEVMTRKNPLLVVFYIPWSPFWLDLETENNRLPQILKTYKINLAYVNLVENPSFADRYNITTIPLILLINSDIGEEYLKYPGEFESNTLNTWLQRMVGNPIEKLDTVSKIENLKYNPSYFFSSVFFTDPKSNSEKFKIYEKISRKFLNLTFYLHDNQEGFDFYESKNKIFIIKKFDENLVEVHENFTEHELTMIFKKYGHPAWMNLEKMQFKFLFKNNIPGLILFYDRNASNVNELEKLMKDDLNIREKDNIMVLLSDINSKIEIKLAEYIGLEPQDLPAVFILDTREEQRNYKLNGEINRENIARFVEDWESNKLERYYKNERNLPQNNKVLNLNSKLFSNFIQNQKEKISFILFYTSKICLHSKQLENLFDSIAVNFASKDKEITFAKIDSSKNEIQDIKIDGFPTLKLFKSLNKSIEYKGERKLTEIKKFIEESLKNNMKSDL